MADLDEIALGLVGAGPAPIGEALRDAYNRGLEAAASQFDEQAMRAAGWAREGQNVTEKQWHTGTALRAEFRARGIRALRQKRP
jgi:hypothetical protein